MRAPDEATKKPAAHSSLTTPFPDNAGARSIGFEGYDVPGAMIPVQREHRVPEAALRITTTIAGERVVDAATPAQFLK
jgi:hypothetical protein